MEARFDDKIPYIRQLVLESIDNTIINKIYLFGSYAYGNPNEDSDIDLCVVVVEYFTSFLLLFLLSIYLSNFFNFI